jgi:SNF2 family DNA or RNA helicase
MNWWEFRKHYAEFGGFGGKEVVGYKNMGELHKLFQENMLRRLKSDKLKELPDVVFRDIRIDMCPKQSKLYEAVKKSIMEELKDTALERIPSALAKLMRLQQVTDSPKLIGSEVESAKLVALEDLVEDLMEGGQKVIIFSKFRTMVEIMQDTYKQYNPAIIHGDISAMSRQAEVHRFQTDPNCRIFIGCSPACREGLTLTAASNVIFMDMEWNWASYSQAWSRAHRIGQKNAVTVHNIICKDTIDEHVYKVVRTKKAISETLLDMKVDKTNAMLAREFISSMLGEVVPGGREDD